MSIKALDKFTVKKLTTAQCIVSVYSVVKELVENALDAGANNVEVILLEKGLRLIEVRDNGSGIAEVDSPYMAIKAYTSKLVNFTDLDSLESYGFRGEALNALCRVSTVKIITRTTVDDAARSYALDHDGKIVKAEFFHRSIGTTVQAEYLFKNYPVRRQSISNSKRATQDIIKDIEILLKDYGICRPEVRFSYVVDNITIYTKHPNDTFKNSLFEVYGTKIISNYEFLNLTNNEIHVELAIPKKDLSDLTPISQLAYSHISINTRPIIFKEFKDLIIELISQHFGSRILSRKKPLFFLKMKIPSSYVDINLEPNKTAILLKNKPEVLEMVKKLLVECYGLEVESEEADIISMAKTLAYFDSTLNDSESEREKSVNKKRKITMENNALALKKMKFKVDDKDKKNQVENNLENKFVDNNNKEPFLPSNEPFSQLPEIDLGEDFSTQNIRKIPMLNSEEVDNITSKMISDKSKSKVESNLGESKIPSLNAEQVEKELNNVLETLLNDSKINNKDNNASKLPLKITEKQWSKGHCLNLQGGTSIRINGPSSEIPKKKQPTEPSKTPTNLDSNSIGFKKFCHLTRERLLEKKPQMNLVELATEISKEWKHLDSEERQYYRDLGKKKIFSDSTASESYRNKIISPQIRQKNKNRLLRLLENSKNIKLPTKAGISERSMKTIVSWDIDMGKIRDHCFINSKGIENNKKCIIGRLNNNIWLVNLNAQIWLLNSIQLFDGLNLTQLERSTNKDESNIIETYFKRWLLEKDDMSLLHPIFNLN